MCKKITGLTSAPIIAAALGTCLGMPALGIIQYDQNVTPDVIFGSGNANGSFTTDRSSGVELGLRAKLRHNSLGNPENTFNSNGDGSYTFLAGIGPGQSFPTARWSFEWSINTNYDNSTPWSIGSLTYSLSMTSTTGASIPAFDPIHTPHPSGYWDHSFGTNSTANGAGVEATDSSSYAVLVLFNNVAQNSWKPHWFASGFDPTLVGDYFFTLSAYNGTTLVASTQMTVHVVPAPASAALLGLCGVVGLRRRR